MSAQQPEDEPLIIDPEGAEAHARSNDGDHRADVGPDDDAGERNLTDLVEEPAKVMRIGGMIRTLLEEVKSAPVDEAGRKRLATVLHASIQELKDGLAPELDEELDRLIEPFDSPIPSESELRIAQAQLVGWLEGLFHGIQTAIYAQQMAARAQLEQMRRALPPGSSLPPGMAPMGQAVGDEPDHQPGNQGGMYL